MHGKHSSSTRLSVPLSNSKQIFSCQWFLTQEILGKQSCSWPPVALPRSLCQMFALSLQHKQSKEVPEHRYLQYTLSNAKKICVSLASCAAYPCWWREGKWWRKIFSRTGFFRSTHMGIEGGKKSGVFTDFLSLEETVSSFNLIVL